MNIPHVLIWGFAATIILTTLLSGCRALGLTRMDVPFMLGTMFTADRDRAKWMGFIFHMVNGWLFALLYFAAFAVTGMHSVLFGAFVGLTHSLFVLITAMSIMPSFHPRMATEQYGPDPTRQLEPPGFMALHYGKQTPIASIITHMLFGAILAYGYR